MFRNLLEDFDQFFKLLDNDMVKMEIIRYMQPLMYDFFYFPSIYEYSFKDNTVLIKENTYSKGIYLIISGKVYVSCKVISLKDYEFPLRKFKAPNYFGESFLMEEESSVTFK